MIFFFLAMDLCAFFTSSAHLQLPLLHPLPQFPQFPVQSSSPCFDKYFKSNINNTAMINTIITVAIRYLHVINIMPHNFKKSISLH